MGDVGLLLSPNVLKSLNNIEKITSRIIVVSFKGNPSITVTCCYSSTNVSDEQKVVNFYNDLSSIVRFIPKHNVLIIGGDMNARLRHDNPHHKYSFHQTPNRNGGH
uniref:Endonuclease/exonuclease/phosphatase domain-containing protein n=1 Tax=Octopus bimaculoides TaxID=37653 RepID=A0A0L8GUK5_OCTBM